MIAETLLQDLRVGLRVLVKDRAFAAASVSVLALGICAVATMFTAVDATILRGFSFPNGDRLMDVAFIDPTTRSPFGVNNRIHAMDFEEFRAGQKSFELVAAYLSGSTVNLTADGEARRYTGAYMTEDFLRILGVKPILGRDFRADDNSPAAPKVVLIGYGVWQRDFAGAQSIVGKDVRLNGKPATIVGVMPQAFSFPDDDEMWIPLYSEFPVRPRNDPLSNSPAVIGLIRPGVSRDQAQAEFSAFARRFASAYPDTNKRFNDAEIEPLIKTMTPLPVRGMLLTMFAFGVCVLLIACVNVMNMQFARATLRLKELAIRSSLGASRRRLIRQMLTESLIVAVVGAVLGVGLAYLTVDWIDATLRTQDDGPPKWMVFEINRLVLLVTVAATFLAVIASGLLPALTSSRVNTAATLNDTGKGNTSRRVSLLTRGLVVFQVAVTVILLIGSMLQVRSIVNQQTIDYRYDTESIMSARLGLMEGDYPTAASRKLFYDRLLTELRSSSQFENVALTSRLRMVFAGSVRIELDGKVYDKEGDRPFANLEQISRGFFDVMGQKILEGRDFADDDLDSRQAVAVVNEAFARKHFGAGSAIGQRFRTGDGNAPQAGPWRTIVGVVSTVRMAGPVNDRQTEDCGFYVPFFAAPVGPAAPEPFASRFATVVVKPRNGQHAEAVLPDLRRAVRKIDANLPLYFTGTPKFHLDRAVAVNRITAGLFSALGFAAMILAAVGIYGVMSFSVSQRTMEFGLRMALGARGSGILAMVLRQGARQVALGLSLGLAISLGIATFGRDGIASMLVGVTALDPLTYVAVFALVTIVALFSVLVPARRATRVRPMEALRAE